MFVTQKMLYFCFLSYVSSFSAKVCFAATGVAVARGAEPNVHEAGRPQKTDSSTENTPHAFGKKHRCSVCFLCFECLVFVFQTESTELCEAAMVKLREESNLTTLLLDKERQNNQNMQKTLAEIKVRYGNKI
jgi:hypothetical protein